MARDWLLWASIVCLSALWIHSSSSEAQEPAETQKKPDEPTFSSQVTYSMFPPPIFNDTPTNISVHPGDIAVLRCSIYRLATKTVTWRRKEEGFPLTVGTYTWIADSRISINHRRKGEEQEEWNLIIRGVTEEDAGDYECQISTKPKMVRDITLHLLDAPLPSQYQIRISGSQETTVGQKIFLQCDATGMYKAPDDVEWIKDGDKIETDTESGTIITKQMRGQTLISVLVVQRSTLASSGNYVCKVARGITSKITVQVKNSSSGNVKRGTDSKSKSPALQQARDADSSSSTSIHCTTLLVALVSLTLLNAL